MERWTSLEDGPLWQIRAWACNTNMLTQLGQTRRAVEYAIEHLKTSAKFNGKMLELQRTKHDLYTDIAGANAELFNNLTAAVEQSHDPVTAELVIKEGVSGWNEFVDQAVNRVLESPRPAASRPSNGLSLSKP